MHRLNIWSCYYFSDECLFFSYLEIQLVIERTCFVKACYWENLLCKMIIIVENIIFCCHFLLFFSFWSCWNFFWLQLLLSSFFDIRKNIFFFSKADWDWKKKKDVKFADVQEIYLLSYERIFLPLHAIIYFTFANFDLFSLTGYTSVHFLFVLFWKFEFTLKITLFYVASSKFEAL